MSPECRTGYRLLLTAAFAEACDPRVRACLRSVDDHSLRGVAEPVERFTREDEAL